MALLDRAALLAKEDLKKERVDLPGGNHVFVRQMTAHENNTGYSRLISKEAPAPKDGQEINPQDTVDMENWPAKLAACTMCNEKGVLLLKPDDWKVLANGMSAVNLDLIAKAALKLNNMSAAAQEERLKNSKGAQGADSNSV